MFDYEHFLRTQQQREYIHSLPNTLKNPDIKVEKKLPDGVTLEYLIKKYKNAEGGETIWDIIVIEDNTVIDKLVFKDEQGMEFIADLVGAE